MERNEYTKHIIEFTAEGLLDAMRPMVAATLQKSGILQPPSMSVRAMHLIDKLDKELSGNLKGRKIAEVAPLLHQRKLLKDFLAVHRTVWLLEGKPI